MSTDNFLNFIETIEYTPDQFRFNSHYSKLELFYCASERSFTNVALFHTQATFYFLILLLQIQNQAREKNYL